MMHGMLVLAANSWMKLGEGRTALMEATLYQHKTEAIRIINERLGDIKLATSDGTVGAAASLVILEVCAHPYSPLRIEEVTNNPSPGPERSCPHCSGPSERSEKTG
jgi:hypothetical protein